MKTTILTFAMALTFGFSASANSTGEDPKLINKLNKWVNKNIAYPEQAVQNQEQGTVYVAFAVVDGEIQEIEVVGGVSETLDEQALETIKNAPVSELSNGTEKDNSYILPIKFALK
jgi:TonB family protein